jgi:hypothetical protein
VNEPYQLRGVRVGAVIAVVAVAAFLVWYLAIRDSGSSEPSTVAPSAQSIAPVATTQSDLARVANKLDQPIYWAGSQPDTKLELTRTPTGAIYVRYLPPDQKIGEREEGYLTVVTFPFKGAYEALKGLAQKGGRITDQVADNGLVLTTKDSPHVYIGFPGVNYEIEVYDPDPKRALSVGASGAVQPVG